MEASLNFHLFLALTLILAFSFLSECTSDYGFTTELVHRDSPRSPFYKPTDTPYQRTFNAIRRSISRANRLNLNSGGAPNTPSSAIVADEGEYLMNISLGTPPTTILGIADTGSDLIWTQCAPCSDCFKQVNPLFDPRRSSTFENISCLASQCRIIDQTTCDGEGNLCAYTYTYGDLSYTNGNLAADTFTLGSTLGRPVSFPKVAFGCGYDNGGIFSNYTSGIVGLGRGNASLITQLRRAIGGKFSYCLVPDSSDHNISSKLNFGAGAVVTGSGVVSTPLIQRATKTFYYLTLEAVSVGRTRIEFPSDDTNASGDEGNIIIDSGSTLTLLPPDFYTKIEAAMNSSVKLPRVRDPSQQLNLCYKAKTIPRDSIPTVTFHFTGADVGLNPGNSFVRIADNIICFMLFPGDLAIYGNLAQKDYLIGYDTQNMKLSFKPVDCTSS